MWKRNRRRKTGTPGVFSITHDDGTKTYVARWKVARRLSITDPLTMRRRTVERRAASFEDACRLRAEGVAAERERRPADRSPAESLGERLMAAEWFEYWVRR